MQLGCLEAFNPVNGLDNFSKQELRRWKNGIARIKSTNSSSELSNKECPLISYLHERSNNADIDLPFGGGIKLKALQLSAMFRLASDKYRPRSSTVEDSNLPTLHLN